MHTVPKEPLTHAEPLGVELSDVDKRIVEHVWVLARAHTGDQNISLEAGLKIVAAEWKDMAPYLHALAERVSMVALPIISTQTIEAVSTLHPALQKFSLITNPSIEDIQQTLAEIHQSKEQVRDLAIIVANGTDATWQQTDLIINLTGEGSDELCFALMDHIYRSNAESPPHVYGADKVDSMPESRRLHWLLGNAYCKPGQTAMMLAAYDIPEPKEQNLLVIASTILSQTSDQRTYDTLSGSLSHQLVYVTRQEGGSVTELHTNMIVQLVESEARAGRCGLLLHIVGEKQFSNLLPQDRVYTLLAEAENLRTGNRFDVGSQEGRKNLLIQLAANHLPQLLDKQEHLELYKNVGDVMPLLRSGINHTEAVYNELAKNRPIQDSGQFALLCDCMYAHPEALVSLLEKGKPILHKMYREQFLNLVLQIVPSQIPVAIQEVLLDRTSDACTKFACRAMGVDCNAVITHWSEFAPRSTQGCLQVLMLALTQPHAALENLLHSTEKEMMTLPEEMQDAIMFFAGLRDNQDCEECLDQIESYCKQHLSKLDIAEAVAHIRSLEKDSIAQINALRALLYMTGSLYVNQATPSQIEWINKRQFALRCIAYPNQRARFAMIESLLTQVADDKAFEAMRIVCAQKGLLPLAPLLAPILMHDETTLNTMRNRIAKCVGGQTELYTSLITALQALNESALLTREQKYDLLTQIFPDDKQTKEQIEKAVGMLQTMLRGISAQRLLRVDFKDVTIQAILQDGIMEAVPLDPERKVVQLSERFSQRFPIPDPLLRYAAGLKHSIYQESCTLLGKFVTGVILGSYPLERYLTDTNPHLEKVFAGNPKLAIAWSRQDEVMASDLDKTCRLKDARVLDTDNYMRVLTCGDVGNSCQATDQSPDTNHCLTNYMMDGKVRMLMIVNGEGTAISRAVMRILYDEQANKPVLQLDRCYGERDPASRELLLKMAIRRAEKLGLDLVSVEDYPSQGDEYNGTVKSLFSPGAEYVDACGGIVSHSTWSIHAPTLLFSPATK